MSSALIASVRPAVRDPRLAGKPTTSSPGPQNTLPTHTNNSIIVENNYKVKNATKQHNIVNSDIVSTDSKLATVNKANTHSGTLNRKDPRLHTKIQGPVNFRGKPFDASSGKTNNNSTSPQSSPTKKSQQKSSAKTQSRSFNKGAKATVSSAKQNTKNIADPSAKSPTKHKKKSSEHSSPHKSEKRLKSSTKSEKRSRDRSSGDKYESDKDSVNISPTVNSTIVGSSPITPERAFKELKGITKNRNYMRRNRAISISPEPQQDVDLRVGAPPEKQPRLQGNATVTEDTSVKSKTSINETSFGYCNGRKTLNMFYFVIYLIELNLFGRLII